MNILRAPPYAAAGPLELSGLVARWNGGSVVWWLVGLMSSLLGSLVALWLGGSVAWWPLQNALR